MQTVIIMQFPYFPSPKSNILLLKEKENHKLRISERKKKNSHRLISIPSAMSLLGRLDD